MSTRPIRPASQKDEIPETVEKTVRERLAKLEEDKKDLRPWPEAKRRILETRFPH